MKSMFPVRVRMSPTLLLALVAGAALALLPLYTVEASSNYYYNDDDPTCWISANPSRVYDGNGTTLSWGSSYANSASITDLGSVSTNGSQIVYPSSSRNYTMTVYGSNGRTATCQAYVTRDDYATNAPTCTISLSYSGPYYDYYNYSHNRQAVLTWNSYGSVTSSSITSLGSVNQSGSQTVSVSGNQTFTMTVSGPGGTNTCQTTSTYYPYYQNTGVSCTLTSSPDIVTVGGSAVLKWTVSGNAKNASLSDLGAVSANGGTTVVYPGASRTYTLTVQDYAGNTNTCSTSVLTSGSTSVTYPPSYYSPISRVTPTTYITLNQVPYTGFGLGPVGTAAYYLVLASVLVAGAYATRLIAQKVLLRS